jgi:hypothetical protein
MENSFTRRRYAMKSRRVEEVMRGFTRSFSLVLILGFALFVVPDLKKTAAQEQTVPNPPGNRPLRSKKIRADKGWVDCGWHLFQGQSVEIWAEGEVSCKQDGSEPCGPDGCPGSGGGFWKPMPKANTCALIARIGEKSTRYFLIGSRGQVKAWMPGKLFLRVNDDNVFDNKGEFTVYLGFSDK